MTVFISYRHTDREQARKINSTLNRVGINTYMDVFDKESQNSDEATITEIITERIQQCSHIIAVISSETIKSWWVSFELGQATALSRRIVSFKLGYIILPAYLNIWPVMTSDYDLQLFIEEYNKDRNKYNLSGFKAFESISVEAFTPSAAKDFHENLKLKLSSNWSRF